LLGALNSIINQRRQRHEHARRLTTTPSQNIRKSPAAGIWQRVFVTIAIAIAGSFMLIFGVWSLLFPRSFDALIDFPPYNEHLLHDVGAFQISIGVSLLLSLIWSDRIGVALVALHRRGDNSLDQSCLRPASGRPYIRSVGPRRSCPARCFSARGRKGTNPHRYRRV
jgi:hypothetical protein